MLFGLKNAPETFQREMNIILLSVQWQSTLVYLDDIVAFLKNANDHTAPLRKALTLLHDSRVTLKMKKSLIFAERINFLGHVIHPERLELSEGTTLAVRNLTDLTT